jgi:hypothetical protein
MPRLLRLLLLLLLQLLKARRRSDNAIDVRQLVGALQQHQQLKRLPEQGTA